MSLYTLNMLMTSYEGNTNLIHVMTNWHNLSFAIIIFAHAFIHVGGLYYLTHRLIGVCTRGKLKKNQLPFAACKDNYNY
jgi:hypothetical protein